MSLTKQEVLDLLSKIQIVKITSFQNNENSDHLLVVQIETKDGPKQIVTGANNFKAGDLVPYLGVGETVPGFFFKNGEKIVLQEKELRGYMSAGMILAEDEIGLSDDHKGIWIVGSDKIEHIKVGDPLTEILNREELDQILKRAGIIEMTPELQEKMDLITKDLAETMGIEDLPFVLSKSNLKIYWGTATTGKPHLGYFVPLMKIADFLEAGCEVTILLADIHAYLDNMKTTWELLEFRVKYYEFIIKEILNLVGVPIEKLKFVKGSNFQLEKNYQLDVLKISALASLRDVQKAGSEVVKQVDSPLMSSMLYPIYQTLDEQYLNVDAQFGGVDQRKIFAFAREYLPKVGYRKRIHLMNVLIPGLGKTGKMSSSEPNSKIDLDDSDEVIKDKINKAFVIDGQVEGNGLLAILKYILFRKFRADNKIFSVEREEKWGGNIEYKTYEEVESDFAAQKLSSADLKPAVAKELITLVTPLREKIVTNRELVEEAYPKK